MTDSTTQRVREQCARIQRPDVEDVAHVLLLLDEAVRLLGERGDCEECGGVSAIDGLGCKLCSGTGADPEIAAFLAKMRGER